MDGNWARMKELWRDGEGDVGEGDRCGAYGVGGG
jgi:hypothetical protein